MLLVKKIIKVNGNQYEFFDDNNCRYVVNSKENLNEGDIVYLFGNNAFKSKLQTYEGFQRYLEEVKGVGPKKSAQVTDFYKTQGVEPNQIKYFFIKDFKKKKNHHLFTSKQIENLKEYLKKEKRNPSEKEFIKELGLTNSFVKKIKHPMKTLLTNPYQIAFETRGIGFKTIDSIAKKIYQKYDVFNEKEFKELRLTAGVFYALKEGEKDGHVFLGERGIKHYMKEKIGIKNLTDEEFKKILQNLQEKEKIIVIPYKNTKHNIVFLTYNYHYTIKTAKILVKLIQEEKKKRKFTESDLIYPENIVLSPKQTQAVLASLNNKITLISGGPGTGKTTTAKTIYKNLKKYFPNKTVMAVAPTGTAAKRLANVLGTEAATIHLTLGWRGKSFYYNSNNKLPADILLVDESSMIDLPLMYHFLSALKEDAKVIFIGDADQLPPVGIGEPFKKMLNTTIPKIILDKVYRTSADNPVAEFAREVNEGKIKGDWLYKYTSKEYKPDRKLNIIVKKSYDNSVNKDWIENINQDAIDIFYSFLQENISLLDIQILTLKNETKAGVNYLNKKIQEFVNDNPFIPNTQFKLGDKVIQNVNNYHLGIMNGEIGLIKDYDENSITVEFIEGSEKRLVKYPIQDKRDKNHIDKNLSLAYVITIHKSQGNEFDKVILLLNDFWGINRKLIYTGVTRTRNKCVILTNYKLLFKGIKTPYGLQKVGEKYKQIERNDILDYEFQKLLSKSE